MERECIDFIYEIERDCVALSREIIDRICKRAIRRMNKEEKESPVRWASMTDDFPESFSFFDVLSVEIQYNYYDEINPHLRDYIENVLEDEYEKTSAIEQFVLDHSECAEHFECDYEAVQRKLFDAFHDMLNAHWQTKKIQEFELNR